MTRRFIGPALIVILALSLAPVNAVACGSDQKCDLNRSCEKTDNGIRCTLEATGDTTEASVRECARSCGGKHFATDGVKVSFKDIKGGVAIEYTTDGPEALKALHAKLDGCSTGTAAACPKDCKHASDCAKARAASGAKNCAHTAKCAGSAKDTAGCAKAKAAGCAKHCAHHAHQTDCSKKCVKGESKKTCAHSAGKEG